MAREISTVLNGLCGSSFDDFRNHFFLFFGEMKRGAGDFLNSFSFQAVVGFGEILNLGLVATVNFFLGSEPKLRCQYCLCFTQNILKGKIKFMERK